MSTLHDEVVLLVNGKAYDSFESYSVNSDLFTAADAFSMKLIDTKAHVFEGDRVRLVVNKKIELTGIVDKVTKTYDKGSESLSVEGRDLMGLVCDSYLEDFGALTDLMGMGLSTLAQELLKNVPFINRSQIRFENGADKNDLTIPLTKTEPGSTKFDILRSSASARGIIFYSLPDGTFVFGLPKSSGAALYSIICKTDGSVVNTPISGTMIRDISQSWSKITVGGQTQMSGDLSDFNVNASLGVPGFPFYKPYYASMNKDAASPAFEAQRLARLFRSRMECYEYTVPDHSQNGRNWTINEIAHINDENLYTRKGHVNGDFLIYARTFEMSKSGGQTTKLRLGIKGAVLE